MSDASKERLEEIALERQRNEEYQKVKALFENPISLRSAKKAWQRFISRYGNAYDPENLVEIADRIIDDGKVAPKYKLHQSAPIKASQTSNPYADNNFAEILENIFNSPSRPKSPWLKPNEYSATISLEEAFSGTKRELVIDNRNVTVGIPKGVKQNTKVRLAGMASSSGQSKDAFVVVNIEKHELFECENSDLYTRIVIEENIAEKGGDISLMTLAGPFSMSIPSGTRSGKKFRLTGKGMPVLSSENEYGDLIVEIVFGNALPNTISIETLGGVATPLVPKETILPFRHSLIFSTATANQSQVELHLCYGEQTKANDNISLGKFILDNIPPAPKGIPQIEVTVEITSNYLLKVQAIEKSSGNEKRICQRIVCKWRDLLNREPIIKTNGELV